MTIPQEERNKRIVDSGRMSSRPDIKAFALSILQDEGLDPALVNFKDDMVGIGSFKKLVFAVYDAGYKDGLEENSTIRGKKKEMIEQGRMLTRHSRIAKSFKENNEINK